MPEEDLILLVEERLWFAVEKLFLKESRFCRGSKEYSQRLPRWHRKVFQVSVVLQCKCKIYSQGGVKVPTGGDSNLWRARERLLHCSRDQQIW